MQTDEPGGGSATPPQTPPEPSHDPIGADFNAQDQNGQGQPPRVEKNGLLYAADGTPVIRWIAGELPNVVDQAERCLMESGVQIFQRDRLVTRVLKRGLPSIRNYKRAAGVLGIVSVDATYLTETLTRIALWEKFDGRTGGWRRINAPEVVAATYLSRCGHWRLPPLWDVISSPTLRPDGTILQTPGYDAATRVFYDPCGIEFPHVPEQPTKAEAIEAFRLIETAFASFPFETPVDKAVALSFVFTALVRRSLPSAPLGAISAPVLSSGKTLLADCVAILATGSPVPAMTFAETDEEAKKTALAVLMEGDPVVLIDNVERPLSGDWLCSILTSEIYKQRMLGQTAMVTVPTRTLMLATGNHIQVAGDLRSRTLLCQIDPKLEHPEQREFAYDLRERLMAQRPQLVAAGLTVMRAFISTGQRVHDFVKQWGRFERWTEMVRAPLVWMDCEDPYSSLQTLETEDPVRGEHLRFVELWHQCFGDEPRTARAAVEHLNAPNATKAEADLYLLVQEIATDRAGKVSTTRLGRWLDRHKRARVGGYQIEQAGTENHSMLWKVSQERRG